MLIDIIAGARPNFMKIAPIIKAINLHENNLEMFIHNCHKFSEWTLKLTDNTIIKSKLLIEELLRSDRTLRGDLFLIK